jgi:hypothetical protein
MSAASLEASDAVGVAEAVRARRATAAEVA